MIERQRVLHYYARYLEHPSGVTDSLNNWAQISMRAGDDVRILAASPRGGGSNEFALESITTVIPHAGNSRGSWIPIGLGRVLRRNDLLVLHEGWVLSNAFASLVARWRGAKVIVMPHGVYEDQIISSQRDLFGMRGQIERWVLRGAAAVHVFYPGEIGVVSAFERTASQFIVAPNGAADPGIEKVWTGEGDYFLWMGRFDVFHKGIDHLLAFWSALPSPRPRLLLAGPDFMGGKAQVAALIEALDLADSVQVRGRVTGAEKDSLLAGCRAYLHPSRWESCSIMLLEALAAGVPSLISSSIHAAVELEPMDVLRSADFSEGTGGTRSPISEVDRNRELGNRARQWAKTHGSWNAVGVEMIRQQTELGLRINGGEVR
jgi:glycosyltransferase involved in cell wall biosynthesis